MWLDYWAVHYDEQRKNGEENFEAENVDWDQNVIDQIAESGDWETLIDDN